jgi:hypothetical protein
MIGRLVHLCERGSALVSSLPPAERGDAQRLLSLCLDYAERNDEPKEDIDTRENFTRELSRLVEFLARRNSRGIPLATLGRAVLAHRSRHPAVYVAACAEAEQKLGFVGV